MSEPKIKKTKQVHSEKEESSETPMKECTNVSLKCDDATSWSTCPTCDSILCEFCMKECDWCIDFGTSLTIEMPNTCTTCKTRICNKCARMCLIGDDDVCTETVGLVECKNCAKDKYELPKCGHEGVWLCKNAKEHYCPQCRYWENAYGKMGCF